MFRLTTITLSLLAAFGCLSAEPRPNLHFRISPLPPLGATRCKALSLNDDRVVAADRITRATLKSAPRKACRLQGGKIHPLRHNTSRFSSAMESRATHINEHGHIVGWTRMSPKQGRPTAKAVIWTPERVTPIYIPNSVQSFAYAMNDKGVVVGAFEHTNGFLHAFATNPEAPKRPHILGTLGGSVGRAFGINEHGTIVGTSSLMNGDRHAFRHRNGKMEDLGTLGGKTSQANDVNSRDQAVGVAQIKTGQFHAFIHKEGEMKDLGTLGGSFSYAYAVYSDLVVGIAEDNQRLRQGFLHDGERMWNLNRLIPNRKNWFITEATDINRKSEILAMARNPHGVPQPVILIPIKR